MLKSTIKHKNIEFTGEKETMMRRLVKNNVNWVGYLDWELEMFHGVGGHD